MLRLQSMAKLCAIDVGSNGIRLSIANLTPKGLEIVEYQRVPIRLGADVFKNGKLSAANINALAAAFKDFAAIIAEHQPAAIRAIATSAMREAKNGQQVIRRIAKSSGINMELISGDEEARLAYLAIADRVPLKKANALLIDIGGGSVEVSWVQRGAIKASESFKLGTVRLLQVFGGGAADQKKFYSLLSEYARSTVSSIRSAIGERAFDFAVGTGGNIEALGDLAHEYFGEPSRKKLSTACLARLLRLLKTLRYKERIERLNLRHDRADVIVPAAIILHQLLKEFAIEQLLIPQVGVKDGVLLNLAHQYMGSNGGLGHEHVIPSTRQLAERYRVDIKHAERTAAFALGLFDSLQKLHRLGPRQRLWLECAAILHDVGKAIHVADHHKHAQYIIRHSPIVGLSTDERLMAALIARYHRKSLPKSSHIEYAELKASQRRQVRVLGGILRLANAMDIEHSGQLNRVDYRLWGRNLTIHVTGRGDLALEIWAMQQRANLLAKALRLRINIVSPKHLT